MYRPAHPSSAPDLIVALRHVVDAVIDGSATRDPTSTLDTIYAAINYLSAVEHLCAGCGRAASEAHSALCPDGAANGERP